MHEVFLPIMVMIFTLAVMVGLAVIFRGWVAQRDVLMAEPEKASSASLKHAAD